MTAAAIQGVFVTYKHVPTRNCIQIVVECPGEAQEAVFAALGYPEPGSSINVAVARLNAGAAAAIAEGPEAAPGGVAAPTSPVAPEGGEHRGAHPYVRAAGILAKDREFWRWGRQPDELGAASYIRAMCCIDSRKELADDDMARLRFDAMRDRFYRETGRRAEVRG